jgi:sugar diacid utilization regulator
MAMSKLKALHIAAPDLARDKIVAEFIEQEGRMKATCEALDIHYLTLRRMIKSDAELAGMLNQARETLMDEGYRFPGVGEYHHEIMAEAAK